MHIINVGMYKITHTIEDRVIRALPLGTDNDLFGILRWN